MRNGSYGNCNDANHGPFSINRSQNPPPELQNFVEIVFEGKIHPVRISKPHWQKQRPLIPEHSITQFIEGLKRGDEQAAQKIWERFHHQLVALANRKLKSSPRKAMDEEDVVQKAFADFFIQVKQSRFPRLDDRNDLWQILAMLVDRRAKDQIKSQHTQKAGGGRTRTESVFFTHDDPVGQKGIGQIEDLLPTPELALQMIEVLEERLATLRNNMHRQIALLKMQGYNNREIAELLNSSERTIERGLQSIRKKWEHVDSNDEPGLLGQ